MSQAMGCQEKFFVLVGHVSKSKNLRASRELANHMIDYWKHSPNKKTTSQMLHLVALTDDATLYQKSIELAADYWEKGLLAEISAKDLLTLMESEYWVIEGQARRSGAGFALKDSLAAIRRRLKD
jgi:hypothetical protein